MSAERAHQKPAERSANALSADGSKRAAKINPHRSSSSYMTQFISATERIYRELSRPQAQPPKPTRATADPEPIALTRADVDPILQRKRSAFPEELQHILDHGKELGVSEWERSQISVDMTIAMAQCARQIKGRPDNPADEFIAKVLGTHKRPTA